MNFVYGRLAIIIGVWIVLVGVVGASRVCVRQGEVRQGMRLKGGEASMHMYPEGLTVQ